MKNLILKKLFMVAVLAASVALSGCGDDNQNNAAGMPIAPGVVAPINPITGVPGAGGVCHTSFGQPGYIDVNTGVCLPNLQGGIAPGIPGANNFCTNGIMNNGYYMCPCTYVAPGMATDMLLHPGRTICPANNFVVINTQYYYYITLQGMWPSFYNNSMYGRYFWNGYAWVWVR
jgi:hypothetical protein